ncbi:hypothetical protein Ancab_031643 [Ancistrocladus abbreviatus]
MRMWTLQSMPICKVMKIAGKATQRGNLICRMNLAIWVWWRNCPKQCTPSLLCRVTISFVIINCKVLENSGKGAQIVPTTLYSVRPCKTILEGGMSRAPCDSLPVVFVYL